MIAVQAFAQTRLAPDIAPAVTLSPIQAPASPRPTVSAGAGDARVNFTNFVFTGNTELSQDVLEAAVAKWSGKTLTFGELIQAVEVATLIGSSREMVSRLQGDLNNCDYIGINNKGIVVSITLLPTDTWDRVHAAHAQLPAGEPRLSTNASWDVVSEQLILNHVAAEAQ